MAKNIYPHAKIVPSAEKCSVPSLSPNPLPHPFQMGGCIIFVVDFISVTITIGYSIIPHMSKSDEMKL